MVSEFRSVVRFHASLVSWFTSVFFSIVVLLHRSSIREVFRGVLKLETSFRIWRKIWYITISTQRRTSLAISRMLACVVNNRNFRNFHDMFDKYLDMFALNISDRIGSCTHFSTSSDKIFQFLVCFGNYRYADVYECTLFLTLNLLIWKLVRRWSLLVLYFSAIK